MCNLYILCIRFVSNKILFCKMCMQMNSSVPLVVLKFLLSDHPTLEWNSYNLSSEFCSTLQHKNLHSGFRQTSVSIPSYATYFYIPYKLLIYSVYPDLAYAWYHRNASCIYFFVYIFKLLVYIYLIIYISKYNEGNCYTYITISYNDKLLYTYVTMTIEHLHLDCYCFFSS